MNRFVKFLSILTLLAFSISNLPVHAAAPPPPGLSVSGTNILADGQPIRLRGINMGDPFWARNPDWYPVYSSLDYNTISQDWRANVVRISVFPTQWKNMDHAALLSGLSQEINAALNDGMYVILSYHVIGWPDGYYQAAYPGNPADTYDSSMSVASSFWTQMAQTYGSDTRIIFDLWNEPVHPDDFTLYGSDPNPLWPVLKGYYENLIQTVRSQGAQNIVIATGNRWASWLVGIKDDPLTDSNVVYAYHKYSSAEGPNSVSEWDQDTGGLIGVLPLLVTEWGYEDVDAGPNRTWPGSESSFGDPFTQWMDENNLGSLAWMYHYDWTPALLKPDGSLTSYGTFAKQYVSGAASAHFAVIGDYGNGSAAELDVANRVKSWSPDFIVTVGDNNYPSGSASTIDAHIGQYYHSYIYPYSGSYGAGATTNKFFPALGNHDWVATNAQPYLNYFSLPGNERYYDFVQGPVHFFMLDSDPHEPGGTTYNSTQGNWLHTQLAASTSPWNLVILHHAPFSSGEHGSITDSQWPFSTWGADAVLSGHDHTYERVMKGSLPYFVNGLGGASLYNFTTIVSGSQVRYNADYGAMLVDASASSITFKFITRTGAVIDTHTINAPSIPAVSSILRANVSPSGASSVNFNVTFSENVTGVDAGDFSLAASGVLGAAVSGVSGSGNSYTVTVNTGSGSGSIKLNLTDNDSILNGSSVPLGGAGAGNGNYTSGETYTITKTWIFGDVPNTYWAYASIESLYNNGITGGCTTVPLNYCPASPVTRAQMAVFLVRAMYGAAYVPPAATGIFPDVPPASFGASQIEKLYNDGITSGCGGGKFCPNQSVTRAQMAVFLVRAMHGAGFVPPAATGVFADVPAGSFGANFIEQLAKDAVTSGCGGGNFCPATTVKRDSMAVFLVKAFSLP